MKIYLRFLVLILSISIPNLVYAAEWYEGGTLHKATVGQWKVATNKNQLATTADWLANVDSSITMRQLKIRSINVAKCVTTSLSGNSSMDSQRVTQFAAICIQTLGYNK